MCDIVVVEGTCKSNDCHSRGCTNAHALESLVILNNAMVVLPYSGYFLGGRIFVSSEFLASSGKNFSFLWYTKPHPGTMQYCFMGENFVVRLSTTKTTKF